MKDESDKPGTPTEEDRPLLERGDTVDRYTVLRRVGRGGMGEVYLARDTELGRKVALKVLHHKGLGAEDAVERFLFEARTTARFNHPHIVAIYGVGTVDEHPYVALEFLEGQTLHERMRGSPPVGREVLRIGLAIAEALKEAQRHQILHRDLKPSNVMIPRDGRLRVVDFGLALRVDRGDVPAAYTGDGGQPSESLLKTAPELFQSSGTGIRGTPMYMSPEQWAEQPTTGASDVWALGVMLWEMAAGRHPYAGSGLYELCGHVIGGDPVPALPDDVDPPLRELIARCVDKRQDQRPPITEVVSVLEELVHGPATQVLRERSPFHGLLPCEERDAELFFGRDAEVDAFLERLRREPVLPVVGASGAGKSSFVQAGVVPRLREGGRWIVLALRPGRRPFRALAARLAQGEGSSTRSTTSLDRSLSPGSTGSAAEELEALEAGLRAELKVSPGRLALRLGELARGEGRAGGSARVLLFIDQLEELVTLVDDDDERRAFLAAVCQAADDPEGPVRVVFTLRDDFLGRLAEGPEARDVLGRVTVLRTPGRATLEEILTRSAAAADHEFDDPGLATAMAAEVDGVPAALPLLQVAGQLLWERRDRQGRLLRRADYEAMGGVAGALAHHADGVLDALPPDQLALARTLLQRLVTPERTRRVVPRGELLADLPAAAGDVLDRLVDGRLVQSRRARKGEGDAEVELVHESLIRSWARFAGWLDEDRDAAVFLAEVGQAASLWDQRGRLDTEVWRGDALRDAERQAEHLPHLPGEIDAFLRAGRAAEERGTQRRRWLIAGVIASLVVIAAVLGLSQREAVRQRTLADQQAAVAVEQGQVASTNLAQAYVTSAQGYVADRNYGPAWVYATAALQEYQRSGTIVEDADRVALESALHSAKVMRMLALERAFPGPEAKIWSCDLSPDGALLALTDASSRLWLYTLDGSREPRHVEVPYFPMGVAFAADGEHLLVVYHDGTLRAHEVESLAPGPAEPLLEERINQHPLWSPDRERVILRAGEIGLLVERGSSSPPVVLGPMTMRAISPDGQTIARATGEGELVFHDGRTGERLGAIEHPEALFVRAFSCDGRRLLVSDPESYMVVDHETRQIVAEMDRTIFGVEVEGNVCLEDGWLIGTDHGAIYWDGRSPEPIPLWEGAGHALVASGPEGRAVIAQPSGVRIWRARAEERARSLPTGALPTSISFSADGTRAVVPTLKGAVYELDVRPEPRLRHLVRYEGTYVPGAAISSDGAAIATVGSDTVVSLFRSSTRIESERLSRFDWPMRSSCYGPTIAFAPDDEHVLVGLADGRVQVLDATTLELERTLSSYMSCSKVLRRSSDGKRLLVGDPTGRIIAWDAETLRLLHQKSSDAGDIMDLRTTADGQTVITAGQDGWVRRYSMQGQNWGHLEAFEAHDACANSLSISPDGTLLLTGSDDHTARVWDRSSGALRQEFPMGSAVSATAFSPDGALMTIGDEASLLLLPAAGALLEADGERLHEEATRSTGLHLEGFTLAVVGEERETEKAPTAPQRALGPRQLRAMVSDCRRERTEFPEGVTFELVRPADHTPFSPRLRSTLDEEHEALFELPDGQDQFVAIIEAEGYRTYIQDPRSLVPGLTSYYCFYSKDGIARLEQLLGVTAAAGTGTILGWLMGAENADPSAVGPVGCATVTVDDGTRVFYKTHRSHGPSQPSPELDATAPDNGAFYIFGLSPGKHTLTARVGDSVIEREVLVHEDSVTFIRMTYGHEQFPDNPTPLRCMEDGTFGP